MKIKNLLIDATISIVLGLIFGAIGIFVGDYYLVDDYRPPWTHYQIKSPTQRAVDIIRIDINSTIEDPSGDKLYVVTDSGETYSITLFQDNWLRVYSFSNWDNDPIESCSPEWPGPSDSHIWDPPPVDKEVMDSAGFRFERPLSITTRCYVLFADGRLEVWTNFEGAYSSPGMAIFFGKIIISLVGIFLGLDIGVVIIIIRKRIRKPSVKAAKEAS